MSYSIKIEQIETQNRRRILNRLDCLPFHNETLIEARKFDDSSIEITTITGSKLKCYTLSYSVVDVYEWYYNKSPEIGNFEQYLGEDIYKAFAEKHREEWEPEKND